MKRICDRIEQDILRRIRKKSGLKEVTSLAVVVRCFEFLNLYETNLEATQNI